MRQVHDKLTNDIRKNVKAKVSVAKTQEKINKVTGSMDAARGSMRAFERMEEKADRLFDEANAVAELNEESTDAATALEAKYAGSSASVDDALEKLKQEMGLSYRTCGMWNVTYRCFSFYISSLKS